MSEDAQALLSRFDVTTSAVDIDDDQLAITRPRDAESLIDEALNEARRFLAALTRERLPSAA